MALQVCKDCATRYAPAGACPHCGGELWISELEADERLAAQGGEPAPSVVKTADDEDGPPDYAAYRVTDLRDLARERGLSPAGAKADLVAQLTAYDAGHPEG